MTISAVKLVSGEIVYGEVKRVDDHNISITDPLVPETRKQTDGTVAMVLNRYLPMVKEYIIVVDKASIITMSEVNSLLEEYYKLSVSYAELADKMVDVNVKSASGYLREVLEASETANTKQDVYKTILENIKPNGPFN